MRSIQALSCSKTEREEQRRRGRERRKERKSVLLRQSRQSRRTRREYEVAGALCFFLHQRNEWHNEATPLNVREPSVALPVGLCRRQKGETREEGGHLKRCDCSHNVENLSVKISSILRRALPLWLTAFFSSRVPSANTLPMSKQ